MKKRDNQSPKWKYTPWQIIQGLEGVLIMGACYLTWFLKPLRDRWGLSREDANKALPGDSIVKAPKSEYSHGIEINAPAEYVWPWVAQMGKSRGGFYSYEALENLIGLQIYNADDILEDYQDPKVGEIIPFGPDSGYPLALVNPNEALVIETCEDLEQKVLFEPAAGYPKKYLHISWLWYVEPLGDRKSRFISRNRVDFNDTRKNRLKFSILAEPMVFAMDRKMCLGIKKRAERYYKSAGSSTLGLDQQLDTVS